VINIKLDPVFKQHPLQARRYLFKLGNCSWHLSQKEALKLRQQLNKMRLSGRE